MGLKKIFPEIGVVFNPGVGWAKNKLVRITLLFLSYCCLYSEKKTPEIVSLSINTRSLDAPIIIEEEGISIHYENLNTHPNSIHVSPSIHNPPEAIYNRMTNRRNSHNQTVLNKKDNVENVTLQGKNFEYHPSTSTLSFDKKETDYRSQIQVFGISFSEPSTFLLH